MEGFVKNETNKAVFRLQRPLPPGGVLSLENAYLVVGEKSGKKKGPAFVKWLKENVFTEEGWAFYKSEGVPYFSQPMQISKKKASKEESPSEDSAPDNNVVEEKKKNVAPAKGAGRKLVRKNQHNTKTNRTAAHIIEADLPEARAIIEKTKDRATLKKALTLSNHFANKEQHRRFIEKRLQEVY